MFYVKNTSNKPIGFGDEILIPDQIAPLPKGYDKSHPTVAFYIKHKFLAEVDAKDEAAKRAEEAAADAAEKAAEAEAAQKKADEEAAALEAAKAAEAAAGESVEDKIKALSKLNLDPLRNLATELGITWVDPDTKAVLTAKITDAYQAAAE